MSAATDYPGTTAARVPVAPAAASATGASRSISVREDRLDAVIERLGELGSAGATAASIARQTGRADLIEALDQVNRLVEHVCDGALRLRRTTVAPLFERLQDALRATAGRLGTEVDLVTRGGETELDVDMLDAIGPALERLACDVLAQGLEPVPAQAVAGEAQAARLSLSAGVEGGCIVLRLADAGQGARRIGAMAARPELASARRAIESLRGSLAVNAAGACVEVRLPLSHALVDGFLVGIGPSRFIVPLEAVVEVIERRAGAADLDGRGRGIVDLRGHPLPVVSLRALYSLDSPEPERSSIVVIQAGEGRFGVMVDRLYGRHQSVVKPLGPLLGSLRGLSGSSVLGGGDVALIFDIGALEQLVSHASHIATPTEGISA